MQERSTEDYRIETCALPITAAEMQRFRFQGDFGFAHDGWAGVFSSVAAGTGVATSSDAFSYVFGDRVKFLRLTPEPRRVAIGIITRKEKLSPAAEKFCQCAREAFGQMKVR